MFRRRPIRARRMASRHRPHPILQRANDMLASGDYAGAAAAFEELANAAVSRNGPAAPHLLIQTGKAKIQAGQVPEGIKNIKQAMKMFIQRREWIRFQRTRLRVVEQLSRLKLMDEAADMENFMADQVPGEFLEMDSVGSIAPVTKAVARLPVSCPGCGGPVRSDRVEWVDEVTAECPYCGSMLRE